MTPKIHKNTAEIKIIPVIFTEMQDDLSESWQKQTDNNKITNFPKIRFKIITDEKML